MFESFQDNVLILLLLISLKQKAIFIKVGIIQ